MVYLCIVKNDEEFFIYFLCRGKDWLGVKIKGKSGRYLMTNSPQFRVSFCLQYSPYTCKGGYITTPLLFLRLVVSYPSS